MEDRKVYAGELAERLRMSRHSVKCRTYEARLRDEALAAQDPPGSPRPGDFPAPDGTERRNVPRGAGMMRATVPYWLESAVARFEANRLNPARTNAARAAAREQRAS